MTHTSHRTAMPTPIWSRRRQWHSILWVGVSILALGMQGQASAGEPSTFVRLKLKEGISIEIPRTWWHLDANLMTMIQTSVEAAIDVSGLPLDAASGDTILAANSMPRSTYASVRISVQRPPTLSQEEARAATPESLDAEVNSSLDALRTMLGAQGLQLLQTLPSSRGEIGGVPYVESSYRRSGPNGPVITRMLFLALPDKTIDVTLAFRESESVLWLPVMRKILSSIEVTSSGSVASANARLQPGQTMNGWTVYRGSRHPWSVIFPSSWMQIPPSDERVELKLVGALSGQYADFSISMLPSTLTDADQFVAAALAPGAYEAMMNAGGVNGVVSPVSRWRCALGGVPAACFQCDFDAKSPLETRHMTLFQASALKNGAVATLTCRVDRSVAETALREYAALRGGFSFRIPN